jgi:probable AcnD-accessory protein PrpF
MDRSVSRIPALFMRGGTSKGVFFRTTDLPAAPAVRDALLLRVIGSPDPYGQQMDGLGGGSSSTSKVVLLSRSMRPGHAVDYLFGAVAIDRPLVDWSGSCGNLAAAVAPAAIALGLVEVPADGVARVPIWQANLGKTIVAHVPVQAGVPCERGDFMLDGVAFPSAEIRLEFLDPGGGDDGGGSSGTLFPTGRVLDTLNVPGAGTAAATLIDAGNPLAIVDAHVLGLTGVEPRDVINHDGALLARAEQWRAAAAVAMGLAASPEQATRERPATPRLAFVAPAQRYTASDGRTVEPATIDFVARTFSMGKLHHAMTGSGAIALAAASVVPGTVVARLLGSARHDGIRFGHPAGVTAVAADAQREGDSWSIRRVVLSRSARILMEGWVRLP